MALILQIGMHSGGGGGGGGCAVVVVAGVIDKQKFTYDPWCDTVNIASRMESAGVAGRIHMSAETYELLPTGFDVELRGNKDMNSHRSRECYLLAQENNVVISVLVAL